MIIDLDVQVKVPTLKGPSSNKLKI